MPRKSIFQEIYEEYPDEFGKKPDKKLRQKIYRRCFNRVRSRFQSEYGFTPSKAQMRNDLIYCLVAELHKLQSHVPYKSSKKVSVEAPRKDLNLDIWGEAEEKSPEEIEAEMLEKIREYFNL